MWILKAKLLFFASFIIFSEAKAYDIKYTDENIKAFGHTMLHNMETVNYLSLREQFSIGNYKSKLIYIDTRDENRFSSEKIILIMK